ncbi:hypothetical protein [Microbulbifer sp. VAAF005]|uniref:hypothetical protein n=1 Tax=Microbulbifer sp. VAAF005 TaxID=3034230 RepID=UPI0024ACBF49|nr:hypothetical protein [Microbulbifer sp. VAAF005]WHI46109.1 hypothetical protein P0078_20685 [Microbulbifer sp. VAAF005]
MESSDFLKMIEEIDWLVEAQPVSSVLDTDYRWDWLPTSRDDTNPFPVTVTDIDKDSAKELASKLYKVALTSLRKVKEKRHLLIDGPHDYTESFKGAALFCVRQAAHENASNQIGKWTEILHLFKRGMWPCGIKENGEIVIL